MVLKFNLNMSLFNPISKALANSNLRNIIGLRSLHTSQVHHLYTPSALGIDGYLQNRKKIREQFENFSEKFRTKMIDFTSNAKNMIFTEDLKNMIHMAEPTDLELVINMVKKFNTQKTEFRFGSFIFGPVVMRMFHFLDAPQEALECFEDSDNDKFFDQLVSYQILLDLLYNNEMFDDMYRVFEKVKEKQLNMTKFPKYPVVLVLAACYKQNTPESFAYAKKLWSEMISLGTVPLRRSATFFSGLALKQGAPDVALESITSQKPHYVTIRNIRAVALSDLDRVDEALSVLQSVLNIDQPDQKDKHTFFQETVTKVRQAVERSKNKDNLKLFEDIENALKDRILIDAQSLDKLITSEITLNPKTKTPPRGMPRMSYNMRPKKNIQF